MNVFSVTVLFCTFVLDEAKHFDGGTITWAPIDPYDNSSSVGITIKQSYAWSYPTITCANNVPITTSGRTTQNWNLTCVVDCTTDGGYSTKPINILTDCTSVSPSLGMMNSQRSHNLTLTAGAHFYLANVGSAWQTLNDPAQSGLQWSIVTYIDLRPRPDSFINTPPVATVVSPQYAIVNQTIQINIPVSDVNAGDDVRCRWSTYTPGYRRRRSQEKDAIDYQFAGHLSKSIRRDEKMIHIRKPRASCGSCDTNCTQGCHCSCNDCASSCSGWCNNVGGCSRSTTVAAITTTITTITTTTVTVSTSVTETTTIDTPGTLKATSSYPHRQAIDECGGICYPGSLPNGTTLSNCTITFTGHKAGTWYAVALQVEDYMDSTSTTPMSSVPVQFLIYVLPLPSCPTPPVILPVNDCLEVQVGISMSFNLYAINLCTASVANITDMVVSNVINGMTASNLTRSPTNVSLFYVTFTWTPLSNQVGLQQLCTIAFTSEKVQSSQYCVTFTVKNSSDVCVTTTTTATTTISQTTTSSSTIISSSSTSSTLTSTTSTSTTSTRTSATTTTVTTTSVTTATTTKEPDKSLDWVLILGLSLLALLAAICCSICCLYWFLCGPPSTRRRRKKQKDGLGQSTFVSRDMINLSHRRRTVNRINHGRLSSKKDLLDNISSATHSRISKTPLDLRVNLTPSRITIADVEGKRISSTVSIKRIKRNSLTKINPIDNPNQTEDIDIKSINHYDNNKIKSATQRRRVTVVRVNRISSMIETDNNYMNTMTQETSTSPSTVPPKGVQVNLTKIPKNQRIKKQHIRAASADNISISRLEKSPIDIRSISNRSKTTTHTSNNKSNKNHRITVTKIPRKRSISQSNIC